MRLGEDLYNLIQLSKGGDDESTIEILEQFNPLIQKYAYKLNYEDAKSELTEKMLRLIIQMPEIENEGMIVSYIQKSIIHEYVRLSKQKKLQEQVTTLLDEELSDQDFGQQGFSNMIFFNLINSLNKRQQAIIKYKYYNGYTVNQITSKLHISRQAVHRNERSALKQLRMLI